MDLAQIVVFEDHAVDNLAPINLARPTYAISCGGYRLWDLLARWGVPLSAVVRPYLEALVAADYPQPPRLFRADANRLAGPSLLVNAALVPSVTHLARLERLVAEGQPCVVRCGQRVAAAIVDADSAPLLEDLTVLRLPRQLIVGGLPERMLDLPLFQYPHQVLAAHLEHFGTNLEDRIASGRYSECRDGVFVAEGVELPPTLVTQTQAGPIVIESGAKIGPFTHLVGPVLVGRNARINEYTSIKDRVALGHTTKVGGEVEASVIEPYSNKQHHGFLGHSYLGSWINLGAGTCNSDLKNTYGEVNVEVRGRRVATGMQFVGCFLGDYAKSAINTGIFTGKTIGVGSMVYGFVTTNVPSFVNYARSFGQVSEVPAEVAVATQARMFARRGVEQRPVDAQLLRDLHAMTQTQRGQLAGEPLNL